MPQSKVNPDPPPRPHLGTCGTLVRLYHDIGNPSSPSMWGIRALCRTFPEECGALVGDSF